MIAEMIDHKAVYLLTDEIMLSVRRHLDARPSQPATVHEVLAALASVASAVISGDPNQDDAEVFFEAALMSELAARGRREQ